jgi:hypothetical protein
MGAYGVGDGELVSALGRLWTTQDTAAALIAQVVARARQLPLFLTDGWKPYTAALLQVVSVVYRPRRRGKVGRKPKPRLVAPPGLFYAQVVKVRHKTGHVVEVSRRVVYGGPRRFGQQWRLRQLGETIQTALMERWYGTLRGLVAPLRRRTRCLSWSRARDRGKVWLMVSLYNFVMPHKSLRQGRTPRTPAMAIGLTDHVWSYREYIWLPVHTDSVLRQQMEARITHLLTPALHAPPGDNARAKCLRQQRRKRTSQMPFRRLLEVLVIVLQDYHNFHSIF